MAKQAHRKAATMRLEKRVSGKTVHCSPAKAKSSSGAPEGSVEPQARGSKQHLEKIDLDIDDLVAAITPSDRHDEITFGCPVGRELL
jgi:hypothetical protein